MSSLSNMTIGDKITATSSTKIYDVCNANILAWVPRGTRLLLDVGCGSGQNSAVLRKQMPELRAFGITISATEQEAANSVMEQCWICDLEAELPPELDALQFDVILFSHVLEHLREPKQVLRRFLKFLQPSGRLLIALPNISFYKHRLQLVLGRFNYQKTGMFDETHLRFFTYYTARDFVGSISDSLRLVRSEVRGNVPLGPLRHMIGSHISRSIDRFGLGLRPNFFGSEILLEAQL